MLTSTSQVEYGIVILCKSINKYMTAILYPIWNYLNQNVRTKEKLRSTQHIDQLVKYKIQNHNLFHFRHTHSLPFIIPRNTLTPFPFFSNPILTKFYPIKNNTIWPYPPYYQWVALKNKPLEYPIVPPYYFPQKYSNRWKDTKYRPFYMFPRIRPFWTIFFNKIDSH